MTYFEELYCLGCFVVEEITVFALVEGTHLAIDGDPTHIAVQTVWVVGFMKLHCQASFYAFELLLNACWSKGVKKR